MAITYGQWSNEIKIIFPTRSSSSSSRSSSSSSSRSSSSSSSRRSSSSSAIICQDVALKIINNGNEYTGTITNPIQTNDTIINISLQDVINNNLTAKYYEYNINSLTITTTSPNYQFIGTSGNIYEVKARAICEIGISSSSIAQTCQSTALKVTTNNTEFTGQISTPPAQATSDLIKIDLSSLNAGNNLVSYYEISINGTIYRTENSHFEFLGNLGEIYLIQARAICDTTVVGACKSVSMTISTDQTLFQGNINQPAAQATSDLIKIDLSKNGVGNFAFYEIFKDGVIHTTTNDHYEFSGTTGQTYLIKTRAVCNIQSSSSLSSSSRSSSSISSSSISLASVSSSSNSSNGLLQGNLSVSIIRTDSEFRTVYFNVTADNQLIDSDTRETDLNHLTLWGTQRNFLQYRFVSADPLLPYGTLATNWKQLFIFNATNDKYTVVTKANQIEISYFDTLKNQIESNNTNSGLSNVFMEFRVVRTLDPQAIQPTDLISNIFSINYFYRSFYLPGGGVCSAGDCVNQHAASDRTVPPCVGVMSAVTAFTLNPLAHISELNLQTLDTGDTSGRRIDINAGCEACVESLSSIGSSSIG
jgi:hypothetical protein